MVTMLIRPPVVVKEPVIRSAHGHRCSELSSVPYPVMTPSSANLDDNSNTKLTEAVVALSVVVRRANCA
jgi:hypothetical protein